MHAPNMTSGPNARGADNDDGFSLVEVIVVLVIVATLMALVVPRFTSARKATNAKNAVTATMALGEAVSAFQLDRGGRAPTPGTTDWPDLGKGPVDLEGRPYLRAQYSTSFSDGSMQLQANGRTTPEQGHTRARVVYTPVSTALNAAATSFTLTIYLRNETGGGFSTKPLCQVSDGATAPAAAGVPACA